jgi:hypothetical protein
MNRQKFKPSIPGKPGVSSIEKHPRRAEIEHDIAVGVPSRTIARKYDTDDLERLRVEESDNLLKNLAMQRARLLLAEVTDSGYWRFGARAGKHDDLVLALALAIALWQHSVGR